jgi:hypothetical protein
MRKSKEERNQEKRKNIKRDIRGIKDKMEAKKRGKGKETKEERNMDSLANVLVPLR